MLNKDDSPGKIVVFRLCGTQGCCPTAEVDRESNQIVIRDDDGGKVTLTKEQWLDATERIKFDD